MSVTGTLKVVTPEGITPYTWNGNPVERAEARAAFDELMKTGAYMATVVEGPKNATQIRSFDEAEIIEKERGVVEVRVSPALAGG